QRRFSHGFLSNIGVSITHRLGHSAVFSRPVGPDVRAPASVTQRTLKSILGFIAKGSYGPILKVKDVHKDKTYAVKVCSILPKSEILNHGAVEQSKEEVIIQRQLKHPFIHNLQDCWQTQRHLFIMCDYCSVGDLYTSWLLKGRFGEDEVRLFAAELGSALGECSSDFKHQEFIVLNFSSGHVRLSDFGLSRRLKRGGRAFTICGTIQYMAPEVLTGGPYNHAADWWSLGIMLFSLVKGEFPLPAEPDHSTMLNKVVDFPYVLPNTFSSALISLLTELLCKNPANRLRNLDSYKMQAFFRGSSFDSVMLQKTPVDVILELRAHPDWAAKARRGLSLDCFDNFDCDQILHSPSTPTELSPTVDLSPATEQTCEA
uniref:Ribosomal protein S6 kinase related n=1 Tax=Sparus aurata TaxID=8175 RepID=A0A671TI50_SPAAU